MLQCINERDRAFRQYIKNKSDQNYENFKYLRNKYQTLIFKAKQSYFTTSLHNNENDSKSLWKSLKNLGLPSKKAKSSSDSNIGLKINGEICFDKAKVCDMFNCFYTTVASTLVSKLPVLLGVYGKQFVDFFYSKKGVFKNVFSFALVSESTVLKYINHLSHSKATGLDGIPARFVKDGAAVIAGPLTHIINLSLIQGRVPDDLKMARVVPLYKKSDKTDVGNYRPVSILTIISKIFERVVYDQIKQYLVKKNLLYQFQSGFRRGFSTESCLIHLSDFIRFEMDKGHMVGMLLLDLQKAFDSVNHDILLMKLQSIGINTDIVNWFQSYLSGRLQTINISGASSTPREITCGVPQGFILGPLLFFIYVNDMSAVVKNKLLLYADDTAI